MRRKITSVLLKEQINIEIADDKSDDNNLALAVTRYCNIFGRSLWSDTGVAMLRWKIGFRQWLL